MEDWDYGISGSDDERKSPGPSGTSKSKSEKKANVTASDMANDEESGQNEQMPPPVDDPKDPAAAYFFLVSFFN